MGSVEIHEMSQILSLLQVLIAIPRKYSEKPRE